MSIRNTLYFLGAFLFLGILLLITVRSSERNASNTYFKNLNLFLTGIVTDKQVVTNDAGLLYVDVRSTSIKEYDVRAKSSYYYCVIHKSKAEILEGELSFINIGDSVVVDCKIDSIKCFRNGKLILKRWLFLNYFPPVTSGVRDLHRL